MGKMTRTLTLAGVAVTAGLAFGAPAMAAPAAPAAPAASVTSAHSTAKAHGPRYDRVAGYYRSLRACDAAGRSGEHRNRWEDYDCNRVRSGGRRGSWALQVHLGGDSHHNRHR